MITMAIKAMMMVALLFLRGAASNEGFVSVLSVIGLQQLAKIKVIILFTNV
jgi:hypothetical protein